MSDEVLFPEIKSFRWADLDGKQLEMYVGYDNDCVSVMGKDENGKVYIIYSGKSHERELKCKYCGSTHAVYWKTQVCIDCAFAHGHDR